MQNENMEVTNNSTSQTSSAGGKIAVNESKHPTSKEDDRLSSEKSIKATSAIDSETGSSKSLEGDFVSFNTPDSATKTLENLKESPTNSSKNVAFCKGDTEANSDHVAKSKNIKSLADFYGKIKNTNFEYKESLGITDLNLSYNLESKPTFDTNAETISKTDSNKTDSTNSLENVDKKREIANRTIKNRPLSAREILKKSIEIRGKRLERIAVSQNLEEAASKVNVHVKSDAKEENIIENIVKVTSTDEENPSETKTVGLNTSQNIEGGDKNVLEVNKIERVRVEKNEETKNTEFLGESATEGDGSISETGVNVVKQNFHKDFQGNSDVKCSETTLPTSDFIENADKIVENESVSIRKGESRKRSNISRNLVERNVGSSPLGEDAMNCGEEDSTSLQTRRLRKRTAPQQSSSSEHERLVIREEKGEKNSSGGKLLRKASKGRRKTAAEINSTQSSDTNECQSSKKLSNKLKLECQSSEKLSTEFGEKIHSEEAEIFEEQSSNVLETSRKSSQSGSRKLRNKTDNQISENFEENFDTKQENIEDLNTKSVESSEKALNGSSKVKRKRGRPKAVSKVIGSVDNRLTSCELSNLSDGKKLPNIEDLLRDVLENLTKSSTEKVKNMPKSSADSVDNLSKNSAEKVENSSKDFAENAKNLPTTSAKDLEKCVASIENVVAVKKKKVGRPKRVGKNHEVRKLLEAASFNAAADVFEEFDNCGVADVNRLEPVARRLRIRRRSTGNSTKYVESDGDDSENSGGKSGKCLESDGENLEKPLANSGENSEKHLENIIVMLADGPKTTIDPQVQLLNELMSGNKSKTIENRDLQPQSSATYCTNNLSEDGLRMIIKKENNNSLENKNSSPEIYEEDIFEYGNVIHKVRYIIRKEKIKQEEAISDDKNNTNHEENIGDNKADEIINNQLIQAIKEEPSDNAEELLLENESNETREYTVNNLDQKEKFEEKPFANQQETIRFRTRNRGGRRSYLIPKSVDISGYVNRCKQTTADNKIDKKYDRNIHGNYTMEIKSEIADAENNNFISNLVGVAKRARRSRRVRRRVRVSDRTLDGTKMSKNKVENSANALDSSENSNSALEIHVESVRNSTVEVDGVRNSTDKVESVRNSTNRVESVRNSTDMVQSARNNIDNVKRLRNSTVDAESVKNSINAAGNVQSSLNYVENVKNSTIDVECVRNRTNDVESVKDSINATGNVENSLNDSENVKNSTEVVGNVENSKVTTSTGPNKILVKSLASLMNNFGSNHSKNGANSAGPSKLPSNRLLVKNLANLVSKLDSIAKNDVKNLEETACKADLHNDNGIVKHSSNLNNEISKSLDTFDSNEDDSEGVLSRSSDSNPNNSVASTLNSDSGKNLDKTGSTLTPGEDVSNMSGTGNSSPENNVAKNLSNNEVGTDNVRMSLRKRKSIINYDDNFFRIIDNFENSISCAEEVRNSTNFVSRPSSSYLATSNHIIVQSDTKIFSRKTKLFSKNNSTCKLSAVCDRTHDKSLENVTDLSNDIETSVNNVNSLENGANTNGKSQLEPSDIVRNHTTNPSRTPEPNCSDNFEIECSSPVKLEANTVPIDFDTVSNGGRHTVSNIDPVSKIESNTVSNRLHSKSNRRLNFDTVSNTDPNIASNTVSNRLQSVSNRGLNSDTVSNTDPNIVSNTVSNRQVSVSNRGLNFDTVSTTDPNFEPADYEEKYSAILEANRLTTVADDEFMKTIESFLDAEVKNSSDGVGKKVRKKRRRPCELPALPESLKCETCGKVLKNRQSFEYHKTTHTDPKKQWMKCSCCQKLLAGERRLKSHMQNYHSLVKTFSCDRCKKIFHSRGNLYRHIVNVHLEPETYTCDICKKSFKKKSYLAQHINMHMGIRRHECNLCGKNFMNRSDLQNHLDAHVGFDRYVCGVCGKRLTSMQAMHVHMKYHTGENMFRCKYCEKEYATKSSLKEHMNVHTGKKYTCDTCGAQFSYRNGYKRHLQTHEGKQQECDICHKVFQRKCYLKKHMTTHMGTEQFMCVYCGKKFIEKSDYNIHVNRHTHAVKFPCEFCGKVFHNKGYLVDHRKIHTGDTKHVCKYCGKKFMKRGLLERHESIHEGTNFVKCDLCGAMLSSVNSCRRHLRGVHGVVL